MVETIDDKAVIELVEIANCMYIELTLLRANQ
jgi:hypothetical protein